MPVVPAFFPGAPGLPEMIIVGIIALLLFGKRLPEVARSLGKGIVEFKKGVHGIEDEISDATHSPPMSTPRPMPAEELEEVSAPKFEPPASEPTEVDSSETVADTSESEMEQS